MKTMAILTGNKQQFDDFVRKDKQSDFEYVYVGRMDDMLWRRFDGWMEVWAYWENKETGTIRKRFNDLWVPAYARAITFN